MEAFFPILSSKDLIKWSLKWPNPTKSHLPLVKKLEKKELSLKARNRIKTYYPIKRRKKEFIKNLDKININE